MLGRRFSRNCNRHGNHIKRDKVFNWLNIRMMTLIFLQKTNSDKSQELEWNTKWGSQIYFSLGKSNSQRVAILIKPNSNIKVENRVHAIFAIVWGRVII